MTTFQRVFLNKIVNEASLKDLYQILDLVNKTINEMDLTMPTKEEVLEIFSNHD